MKLTDYKFWYIKRNDDGFITEVAIRFYEGDIIDGKYVRGKRLREIDLKHLGGKFRKEENNDDTKIYHQDDFGNISTDDELRIFLNKELKKDKGRKPIKEQKI